jgi:uncharacterized protein YrrD
MNENQKAEQLKWSELKGRAVVDIATAKRVGTLDDLVLDPQTRDIVGLKYNPGLFSAEQTVPVADIYQIGPDAITLRIKAEAKEGDPKEEQLPKGMPTLTQVVGNQVVTGGGKIVGDISNVQLSLQPLGIIGYEVSKGGMFSKTHKFEITPKVHYGEKLVIIPDSLLDTFTPSP